MNPFDHTTYDDERQLREYRANMTDGTYQGPNVEPGRPGPDGKVASTEAPTEETAQPTEQVQQPPTQEQPTENNKLEFKGVSKEDAEEMGSFYDNLVPRGLIDFGMDVVGNIPGIGAKIDDAYDEATRFKNPNTQAARDMASVIVPSVAASMVAGPLGTKATAAINGGKVAQGLATAGIAGTLDVAIAGFSDYSERDEGIVRGIDDFLEKINRPLGLKMPEAIKIMDDDSPEVRKRKLMMEAAGLSIIGDAIGYALSAGKPIMRWFEPKDQRAATYKQIKMRENPDPDTVFRTQELDEEIMQLTDEIEAVNGVGVDDLISRRDMLLEEQGALYKAYFNTGRSRATTDPLASYVQEMDSSRAWQTDEVGAKKLQQNPNLDTFDPDVQSQLGDAASRPRQSIPRANVARNAADIAANRSGVTAGLPPPLLTYPMMKDGLELGTNSRMQVRGLLEEQRRAGEYSAIVDGYRFTKKQMDESALDLFTEIVQARDVDMLREALMPEKYEKLITRSLSVNQLNDAAMPDVGKAIKYLSKEFLGEDIAAMSARAIETTAKEISVYTDAMRVFKGQVDEDAVMDTIIDKIKFLSEEYSIAKYSAHFSLRNFGWWNRKPNAEQLAAQFTEHAKKNHDSALNFHRELKQLKETDIESARTLILAYDLTEGDVTSMAAVTAWAKQQLSPMGMLKSGKDGRNAFSEGLWGVLYNNVLSGLSAGRAAVGAFSSLALKPVDYMIGAGVRGALGGDFSALRKGTYAFAVERDTIGRALSYGWQTFRKASRNPEQFIEMMRKDHDYARSIRGKMEVLDRMGEEFTKKNDLGSLAMLRWTQGNYQASLSPFARYGTNLMIGVDAMSTYMTASMVSKFKTFDEAYTAGMRMNDVKVAEAQRKQFEQVFDVKTNLIKSDWLNSQARDIALNEENALASNLGALISKYPALQYAIMFPSTSLNSMRKMISYTPFSLLPNSNRYAKTLYAKTPEQIDEVMTLHNIDVNDPDKLRIVDNLKNEYLGRIATGGMIVSSLAGYGIQGNIRGNYPRDKKARNALMSTPGWKPKTIKVAGNWVSYAGVIPLDPLLTIIGDLSYYANDISEPFKQDLMQKLIWTTTQAFASSTPLTGIEPLVAWVGSGDDGAMQRFLTNTARMAVPLSSGQGVLAKALDNANKEVYNDLQNYIGSRIPFVNMTVPDKIDWWTGTPVNEIDNPILRVMNAVNPIPVTQSLEPWREWINQSGLDLSTSLLTDTTGTHRYSAQERNIMSQYIGEQQIWKKIYGDGKPGGSGMMFNKKYNDQLDIVRAELSTGKTYDDLQPDTKNLPVVVRLNRLVQDAKRNAENKMFATYPTIAQKINGKKLVDNAMKAGDPSKAYSIAEKTQQELQQLGKFK